MVPTWAFQGLINVTDGCLTSILPCVAHVGVGGNIGSAAARDYHAAIGEIIIKYNGTLERYADDGVMVVFNDPVPVENTALQAVLIALELRDALGALSATWSRLGHEIGFGIGIAHGFATLGTIGFEGVSTTPR